MEAFFAFLGAILALVLLAVLVVGVIFPLLSPGSSANGLAERFLSWVVLALYALPTTLSAAVGNLGTHLQSFWKLYLVAFVMLLFSFGWMAEQNTIIKGYDAYETVVVYPFNKNVLLPVANVARMTYSGTICWVNLVMGFVRYLRWALMTVATDCPEFDGGASITAAGEIPILPVLALRDFVVSGFTEDLAIAPTMNALADTMTTFGPMAKCQCEAIYPVFPMLLDDDYGLFQSSRLHALPQVLLNLEFELFRTHVEGALDIVAQIGGKCSTVNDTRECLVTRGPNYDRAADLTCQLGTHTTDLLDDALNAVLSGLEEAPWNVVMPWPRNPRIFGMLAMPLCVLSDSVYLGMDMLTHADLFFTLPGRGYAGEVLYERPVSRWYNVSTQIQAIGDDLGTEITSDMACVVARLLNLVIGLVDIVLGIFREILAVDFDVDDIRAYMTGGIIAGKLTTLRDDADQMGLCIERIGDKLGHGPQTVLDGFALFGSLVVDIANGIMANANDILPYLSGPTFEASINSMNTAWNLVCSGLGGSLRQLGGFGSAQCSIRNLTATPDDLDVIQIDETYLNIMCALGNLLEMIGRSAGSLVKYVLGVIIGFVQVLGGATTPTFALVIAEFQPGGSLDLERPDGVIEHTCHLADAWSMFVPSLLNLADDPLVCPEDTGRSIAEVLWNIMRSFFRMFMLPFRVLNVYIRAVGVFGSLGSADLEKSCEEMLVPYWEALVSPVVQIGLSTADIGVCFIPNFADGAYTDVINTIGGTFIDTGYDLSDGPLPCDELATADGGHLVDGLCTFVGEVQGFLDFLVAMFEDGFWQAIWNLIAAPLEDLLNSLLAFFSCLWGNVSRLFTQLGECGGALIDIDLFLDDFDIADPFDGPEDYLNGIEDHCGDWNDVFVQCHFELDIPNYDIDSVYPTYTGTAGAPGVTPLVATDIKGSCCAADVCTGPKPLGPEFFKLFFSPVDGGDPPQTPQTCSEIATGTDINVFIPGKNCYEQDVCDNVVTNVSAEEGACCFSGDGAGQCQDITYSACVTAGDLSGFETGVFIPGERCSSLDGTCNLRSSPNSRQLGCCIKELAPLDLDALYLKREYDAGVSGNECYNSQQDPSIHRAYYIPGDATCGSIQATEEGSAFLNGSNTTAFDLQGCVPKDALDSNHLVPGATGQRGRVFTDMSSACRISAHGFSPQIYQPLAYGLYTDYGSVASSCTAVTGARTWCCRQGNITYSRKGVGGNIDQNINNILDYSEYRTYPFADAGVASLYSLAQKRTALFNDFTVYGYRNGECEDCDSAVNTNCNTLCNGPCGCDETLMTPAIAHLSYAFFRMVPKSQPAAPIIAYPQFGAFPDPVGDTLVAPDQVMHILYPPNVTEMEDLRDNMDEDCQVFFYPNLTLPMATRSLHRRSFGDWNPRPPLPGNPYVANARIPGHPCHRIFMLANSTANGTAEHYLIRKEFGECMVSDALTHAIGYLLYAQAGERVIHPHYFIDLRVQWSTWYNVSRAMGAAFRHTNEVFRAEGMNETLNVSRVWTDYAAANNITDLLGIRVGHLMSTLANHTLAFRRTGRGIPFWLLPFQLTSSAWYNFFPGARRNSTFPNATQPLVAPPALSPSGTQLWADIWDFNWITYDNATFNATGLQGMRASLTPLVNHPMLLMDDGLALRGMTSYYPRAGAPGGGDLCDPRDEDCLKCRLISETATAVVDHILNCVEDLQDTKRFNLNVTALDLLRTNTFEQDSDPRTCDDATLGDFAEHDPLGFGTWLVDTFELRDFLGRVACYARNTDATDPQSPLFWIEKLIFCTPSVDGACSRGRAGLGLWLGIFWATVGFAAVGVVTAYWLPFVPLTAFFTLLFWVYAVWALAYFWSPSCGVPPLIVWPDCAADDLFFTLQNATAGDCRQYGDIFDGRDACSIEGRDFPQCSADPLNFDLTGFRHLFYVLDLLPKMTDFLDSTQFVLISWIREVDVTSRALSGISAIRGTPEGDFCFWANVPALFPVVFILLGVAIIFLVLVATFAIIFLLIVGAVTLLVHGLTALLDIVARVNVDRSRFYFLRSRQ
jgi:hypothetical protein